MRRSNGSNLSVLSQVDQLPCELPLQDLLPANLRLEWNPEIRMLTLFSIDSPPSFFQQRFTRNEWILLANILHYYPHYAPYELLLAAFTLLSPDDCRRHLREARMLGSKAVVQELKPVYRALSGVRIKLKKLYPRLKISLVRNAGYALTLAPECDMLE